MEKLRVLLIANRGEIAVRLIRTARKLKIYSIAIYTSADAASSHVVAADKAVLLEGPDSQAYLDGEQIVAIARQHSVDAIVPGYGFLSENTEFARHVSDAGMVFVGPSTKCIDDFGIKHTARELAEQANVPIVPGSKGLIRSESEAVDQAAKLTYPVMLKATAGGGGMGLSICLNDAETRESFRTVQSRGETLFKNSGIFMERYYPSSHHIEVQVFGNGQGKAIHFGERECSIQRRHQKVIEECPSPFVSRHHGLRKKLTDAAVKLAESIKYASAGTIEYLVDDVSGDFFFLEMNTRLQVEHGITELCYDIDLVELMLRQADAELQGKGGLDSDYLAGLQPESPKGASIEARVYAENPAKDYAPSPGILQEVIWREVKGSRIDTWVHRGTQITSHYDPLLAKVMIHSETRAEAVEGLTQLLRESTVSGPPTNMDFLAAILADERFKAGATMTNFLNEFQYRPAAIDVLQGGSYTLIEDWPGRPETGRGFSHAGPMDEMSFRIANMLVGNDQSTAGIEITLSGPDLRFTGAAIVALTGAPITAKLDDKDIAMWARITVEAGQRLSIGKTTGNGCRAYLAIYGGLPSIATWFNSKSTAPTTAVGGHQGRALASGDFLVITKDLPQLDDELKLPDHLISKYPSEWDLFAMPGPYDEGYLTDEYVEMLYSETWKISHNASRSGIRLIGPRPKWARDDGGEGGSHPSNVIEYGYALGTINFTGDDPCLFPVDAPDFGGFVSVLTIIKADFWKIGQLKAGDRVRLHRVSYEDAIQKRQDLENFLEQIESACKQKAGFDSIRLPQYEVFPTSSRDQSWGKAVIHRIPESSTQPLVTYRQGGDDFLLIDYGHGSFDLNHRCRAVTLYRQLLSSSHTDDNITCALHVGMPCGNSLMLHFSSLKLSRSTLLNHLLTLESQLGDLSTSTFPSRKFTLPITFTSPIQRASLERYMSTQRPYASYLPDPFTFVASNNDISPQALKDIFTKSTSMVVAVGFFVALPIALPIDPRHRIQSPKMNPSRIHTPAGQVGWGGSCMCVYNVTSPGGYMPTGLSIPTTDVLGSKLNFTADRPWLFNDFDQLTFREVSEAEHAVLLQQFYAGRYTYEYEDTIFDLAAHNRLLEATKGEVAALRQSQREAQTKMARLENELYERWRREKDAERPKLDDVEELLTDPNNHALTSPTTGNVWKVLTGPDTVVSDTQTLCILEAMKLEIPVRAEAGVDGMTVVKVLVEPGQVVEAGGVLMVLRQEGEGRRGKKSRSDE